jgi:hypothetical protein
MIKSLRDVSFDSGASLGDGRREFCLTLFRHGIPTVYRWGLEAHASRDHTLESPLWEGYHESRRCSRNTHPESYSTKYTSSKCVCVCDRQDCGHPCNTIHLRGGADPHSGLRTFHQKSTCLTQLTLGPNLVT